MSERLELECLDRESFDFEDVEGYMVIVRYEDFLPRDHVFDAESEARLLAWLKAREEARKCG